MNILYIIVFPNNKKYVGITNNFRSRKNKHKFRSTSFEYSHLKLYRAIKKYGFDNLIWKNYKQYKNRKDANNAEIKLISQLDTTNIKFGYNTTLGGEGSIGLSPTAETREKISKANRNRPKPPGFSEHLSKLRTGSKNPMYGKKSSKKQKRAVSKATSGENNINAKLSNRQANKIREKYKSGKYLIKDLAELYNLNINIISRIIKRKTYTSA